MLQHFTFQLSLLILAEPKLRIYSTACSQRLFYTEHQIIQEGYKTNIIEFVNRNYLAQWNQHLLLLLHTLLMEHSSLLAISVVPCCSTCSLFCGNSSKLIYEDPAIKSRKILDTKQRSTGLNTGLFSLFPPSCTTKIGSCQNGGNFWLSVEGCRGAQSSAGFFSSADPCDVPGKYRM